MARDAEFVCHGDPRDGMLSPGFILIFLCACFRPYAHSRIDEGIHRASETSHPHARELQVRVAKQRLGRWNR